MNIRTAILALLFACSASAKADENRGIFIFDQWAGPALRVFYTKPPDLAPDRPLIIVMHGQSRAVERYHDDWSDLAGEHGFLLLVPEFTREDFPGSRAYNLGNRFDEQGAPVSQDLWSFSAIVPLFEHARERFGMSTDRFSIYGHSAGSQFVHRFLLHLPDVPVDRVVLANAGWYTMPDFDIEYPYGLSGSRIQEQALRDFLGMPVTVLLGDADTLTDQSNLRQSPEANAQGPHRYARGHTFFEKGQAVAGQLGVPFNWQLATVPNADHDNAKMAPAAARYLMQK